MFIEMHISFSYASILALLFVCLRLRKINIELGLKKGFRKSTNEDLAATVLAKSNFSENVPLGILLIYFVELSGAHHYFIHLLGMSLFIGSGLEAYSIIQRNGKTLTSILGSLMTLLTLSASALAIVQLNGLVF